MAASPACVSEGSFRLASLKELCLSGSARLELGLIDNDCYQKIIKTILITHFKVIECDKTCNCSIRKFVQSSPVHASVVDLATANSISREEVRNLQESCRRWLQRRLAEVLLLRRLSRRSCCSDSSLTSVPIMPNVWKLGTVAIKKDLEYKRYKNREQQTMRLLDHPNFVLLKHCFLKNNTIIWFCCNICILVAYRYVPELLDEDKKANFIPFKVNGTFRVYVFGLQLATLISANSRRETAAKDCCEVSLPPPTVPVATGDCSPILSGVRFQLSCSSIPATWATSNSHTATSSR
ncbi:hypothetical protein LXL04_031962 [Taraxacum kok-saghyz]